MVLKDKEETLTLLGIHTVGILDISKVIWDIQVALAGIHVETGMLVQELDTVQVHTAMDILGTQDKVPILTEAMAEAMATAMFHTVLTIQAPK